MGKTKKWTQEEIDYLTQHYPDMTVEELSTVLHDRTKEAIRAMIKKLCINKRIKKVEWTKEEDDIIFQYYISDKEKCFSLLNHRSHNAVVNRARVLGAAKKRHIWTQEELDFVIRNRYILTAKEMEEKTGISEVAIYIKMKRMGYAYSKKPNYDKQTWTEEEIDILKKYFPEEGTAVHMRIPNHSKIACKSKARELSLSYSFNDLERASWSKEENSILKKYYEKEGYKTYLRLDGRSPAAVIAQAHKLGLYIMTDRHPKRTTLKQKNQHTNEEE